MSWSYSERTLPDIGYRDLELSPDRRSVDLQTIKPPPSYMIGLFFFYGSLGLTFINMNILEDVDSYRTFIATMSAFGFLLAFATRGPADIEFKQYPLMSLMIKVWLVYSIYLTIVTYARGGEIGRTIYAGTVFYYMILSMMLAYRHIQAGYDNKYFWQIIVIMAVLSTSVNFYFARFSSAKFDESEFSFIEDMRSQIISGSNMIIIAVGMIGIVKARNLVLSYFLVNLIMFIYIVSKTRNVLLGVALLVFWAVLVSEKRFSATFRLLVAMLTSLIFAYIVPLYTINYDIIDAWFGRVFTEDDSISIDTFFTRVAEYKSQLLMLTQDVQSGIFGFGYLQTTIWDTGLWDILFPTISPDYYYTTRNIGMHSTWINSLFHGGFIMGLIPTISAFFVAGLGFRQIFRSVRERARLDLYGLYGFGVVVYMLIPSSFGMIYVDRISTVSFGVALIYALYGWEKDRNYRNLDQMQSASPPDGKVTGQLAS